MNRWGLHTILDQKKVENLYKMLSDHQQNESSTHMVEELKTMILYSIRGYKDLMNAISYAMTVLVINQQGLIQYTDEKFEKWTKQKLTGRKFSDFLGMEKDDAAYLEMMDKIKAGKVWQGELSILFSDHPGVYLHATIAPLREPNNANPSILFLGANVTPYKKQELTVVEQARNEYNRTMNALVNLVFKVGYDPGRNQYYYKMFEGKLAQDIELTTDKVQGKTLVELFGEQRAAFYNAQYQSAFQGNSISYKHQYHNRSFYSTLSPVEENGEVVEIIGSSIEITSHEEAELKIQHMARHDPLTDLPNRAKLQSDLDQWLAYQTYDEITALFCNLDRFKYVNDALGHMAGDQVLQIMAKRILSCLDSADSMYRIGGDEFILLIKEGRSKQEILRLGRRILKVIEQPLRLMNRDFFITASIGVSQYPERAESIEEIIGRADIAMHYCKLKGRHNILFYTEQMDRFYNQIISLEGDLRKALSRNELSLHYQPKVNVTTGFISGMEALVRWEHPERGTISPGEFIPVAEETGLISQVDDWVMYEACRQNQQWIDQGYAPERVAVNVSANEIQRNDFAEKVHQVLRATQMEPQYLEIEVTENSVMQNTEDCIRTMQDLKAMGVSLAIDDFGTGYSSLSYLRQFPIHFLKIDQDFIKDVLKDPSDAEIVKAMIQLGEAFKLEVIAEGVEREDVLDFLKENDCAYYQGYHFSKPLAPDDMEKLLTRKQTYLNQMKNPGKQ